MMLHVFAMGAVGGLLCGAVKHLWFPGSDKPDSADPSIAAATAEAGTSRRLYIKDSRIVAAGAGLVCACAAAFHIARQRRNGKGSSKASRRRTDGRIPLQDLVRFKERQWFVEELENARDADANAMLRLAKMYLHGQGCQRNIALAQEWVRKARSMGIPASLDELFATDDPDPRSKLRSLVAQEERRRAARKAGPPAAAAYAQQRTPHQHTAAA